MSNCKAETADRGKLLNKIFHYAPIWQSIHRPLRWKKHEAKRRGVVRTKALGKQTPGSSRDGPRTNSTPLKSWVRRPFRQELLRRRRGQVASSKKMIFIEADTSQESHPLMHSQVARPPREHGTQTKGKSKNGNGVMDSLKWDLMVWRDIQKRKGQILPVNPLLSS